FVAGPATPQLYTLSLHDALPISESASICGSRALIFLTMPPSWRSRRSLRLPKKAVSRRLSIEGPVWKQEKGARRPFSWQLPIVAGAGAAGNQAGPAFRDAGVAPTGTGGGRRPCRGPRRRRARGRRRHGRG